MFLFKRIGARLPFLALILAASCTNHVTNVVQTQAVAPGGVVQPAAPAAPANPTNVQLKRVVLVNTRQRLDFGYSLNPDCSVVGQAVMKVKSQPMHGTLSSEPAMDFPNFAKDNIRSPCNTARVQGLGVFYSPAQDYTGSDQLVFDLVFPNGGFRTVTVMITVE